MSRYVRSTVTPILSDRSTLGQTYLLFGIAMLLTGLGAFFGATFALPIIASGWMFVLLLLELAIVFSAGWWSKSSPLNILMFLCFPFFSGLTITPFLLSIIENYANGVAILLNAAIATSLLTLSAGVFAYTTTWNLSGIGRFLFLAIIGMIIMSIVQIFVPALRTGVVELMFSAGGIVLFSLFTAYDIQRIEQLSRTDASPFLLALSLYLDIFNLFLYVVRFMLALSGNRR